MKFNTVSSANTTQYPDIPDDGLLFISGGYVLYTQTHLSSMTLFYSQKMRSYYRTGGQVKRRKAAQKAKKRKEDNMPARNKKNCRTTKTGGGMTSAGVASYRRKNPGSKLQTAVTGKVKPGSKSAKRRKSFCARSAGQMKKFPKAANDPNSRLRQARKRWRC